MRNLNRSNELQMRSELVLDLKLREIDITRENASRPAKLTATGARTVLDVAAQGPRASTTIQVTLATAKRIQEPPRRPLFRTRVDNHRI